MNSQLILIPALFVSSFTVVSATTYMASGAGGAHSGSSGLSASDGGLGASGVNIINPAPPPPLPPAEVSLNATDPSVNLLMIGNGAAPPVQGITGIRLPPVVGVGSFTYVGARPAWMPLSPLPAGGAGGYIAGQWAGPGQQVAQLQLPGLGSWPVGTTGPGDGAGSGPIAVGGGAPLTLPGGGSAGTLVAAGQLLGTKTGPGSTTVYPGSSLVSQPAPVPLPAGAVLLAGAMGLLNFARRRKASGLAS